MKACLLTIFLLVFATIAKTQDLDDEISFEMSFDSSLVGSNLCETAQNMAKRDIELGRFATTVSKKQFSKTFQRLMLKKFNVHVFTNGTCIEDEFMNCYRGITFPIIKEKFGENILQETFNEAIELDNLNGKLKSEYYILKEEPCSNGNYWGCYKSYIEVIYDAGYVFNHTSSNQYTDCGRQFIIEGNKLILGNTNSFDFADTLFIKELTSESLKF